MDEVTKWKVRWLVGFVAMGWVFMLWVPTEDGQPVAPHQWWIWLGINAVALVRVHLWVRGSYCD